MFQPQQQPMQPLPGAPQMAPAPVGPAPGGQPAPGAPVTIDAVMELLRDGVMRRFRIDIEVDSTVAGDETQERQDRNELIKTTTAFVKEWGPIVAAQPLMADLAGELLLFGTRAFRVGRSLEEVIEETVDKLEQAAAQPKPPPQPDPTEQAKIAQAQIKAQAEGAKAQTEVQSAQMKAQADERAAQLELMGKAIDQQHATAQHRMGLQQIAADQLAAGEDARRAEELANLQHRQAMASARKPKGEA